MEITTHRLTVETGWPIFRFEILVPRNTESPEIEGYKVWDRDYYDLPGQGYSRDIVIYEKIKG